MARESKVFVGNPTTDVQHYECFGWELLGINGKQISMTRDTKMKNYSKLVQNEARYEEVKTKYNALKMPEGYKSASAKTAFILLLLLIVPGVLYIVVKTNQKQAHKVAMDNYHAERDKLESEMEAICQESRAEFFK